MRKFIRTCLCAVVIFSLCTAAMAAEKIAAIRVEGNRTTDSKSILQAIESKVGMELSEETIKKDAEAIRDLGLFSKVEAKFELSGPDEGVLTYIVTERPPSPKIAALRVEGNEKIVSEHILHAVESRVGKPLDQETVMKDLQAIYDLGFFSYTDAKFDLTSPDEGTLTYVVIENPVIKEIKFQGSTVYSQEKLQSLLFTKPGQIFNRVFFRNDIQRLREQFQKDGYVMIRIQDVQVEEGTVNVVLIEPRIHEIDIRGNKLTKTYVVRRYIPMKAGDMFNSVILRHSLARLRKVGFFEDVTVGFEPVEDSNDVDLILTVKEKKTASLIFSVSYGSSSGLGGGVSFRENNVGGRARVFEIGFDVDSDDEKNYWVNFSDPYMDTHTFSWKIGAYSREDDDLTYRYNDGHGNRNDVFDYEEKRDGGYFGFGKKFGSIDKTGTDSMFSWFLTFDWHKSKITYINSSYSYSDGVRTNSKEWFDYIAGEDSLDSKVFSTTLEISRNNMDKYMSYPKGDRETIGIEQSWEFLGGEWDYTKYWAEAVAYIPIFGIEDFIDLGNMSDENPVIFAARVRAGFSSGDMPLSERFSLGGANSLRGYESGDFKGHEMFLANAELRIPIDENFSLVVFYDIGNAWDTKHGDTGFDLNDLYDSPGVGVRVKTPLGNIRVDVAKGDDDTEFHFGFGEMF